MGWMLDFIYLLAGLLFYPFYYRRLRRTGRDTSQIWKRLQTPPKLDSGFHRVLVHAVSVGEVQAAVPLIRELERILPSDVDIAISVGTVTGKEQAEKQLPEITSFFMPPDLSFLVKRMLRRSMPSVIVLMELELWPNLIRYSSRDRIPVVVVNGRISERSFNGYRKLGWWFRRILDRVSMFGVQTPDYARRLVQLGVSGEKIAVLGNVKYDQALTLGDSARVSYLRNTYKVKNGVPLLVAGSTHPGEEEIVVDAYKRLKERYPDLRLILAPRHPGRITEIVPLLDGLDYSLRSEIRKSNSPGLVLVDVIGELAYTYQFADAAYIGGSMVEHGGQNPLEAAAAGIPLVFGPHMFNFEQEAGLLVHAGGAVQVQNTDELVRILDKWFDDAETRRKAGAAARAAIEPSRGASARYAEVVRKYLAEFRE